MSYAFICIFVAYVLRDRKVSFQARRWSKAKNKTSFLAVVVLPVKKKKKMPPSSICEVTSPKDQAKEAWPPSGLRLLLTGVYQSLGARC